eukprot:g68710.t1
MRRSMLRTKSILLVILYQYLYQQSLAISRLKSIRSGSILHTMLSVVAFLLSCKTSTATSLKQAGHVAPLQQLLQPPVLLQTDIQPVLYSGKPSTPEQLVLLQTDSQPVLYSGNPSNPEQSVLLQTGSQPALYSGNPSNPEQSVLLQTDSQPALYFGNPSKPEQAVLLQTGDLSKYQWLGDGETCGDGAYVVYTSDQYGTTADQCSQACDRDGSTVCLSFQYNRVTLTCQLFAVRAPLSTAEPAEYENCYVRM